MKKRMLLNNVFEFGKLSGMTLHYAICNHPKAVKEILDARLIVIDSKCNDLLNAKLELL